MIQSICVVIMAAIAVFCYTRMLSAGRTVQSMDTTSNVLQRSAMRNIQSLNRTARLEPCGTTMRKLDLILEAFASQRNSNHVPWLHIHYVSNPTGPTLEEALDFNGELHALVYTTEFSRRLQALQRKREALSENDQTLTQLAGRIPTSEELEEEWAVREQAHQEHLNRFAYSRPRRQAANIPPLAERPAATCACELGFSCGVDVNDFRVQLVAALRESRGQPATVGCASVPEEKRAAVLKELSAAGWHHQNYGAFWGISRSPL